MGIYEIKGIIGLKFKKIILETKRKARGELWAYIVDNSPEMGVNRKKPAIIICPGGSGDVITDREGEPVAIKMLSYGFQAFVLKYSVKPYRFPTGLEQLAKAVSLVRKNQDRWHIDPQRIIVGGFSAGGYIAASLGTFWNRSFLAKDIGEKALNFKPNGLLLAYAVITSGKYAHKNTVNNFLGKDKKRIQKLSLENQVSKITPPAFIWHTFDDSWVPVENSLLFARSLRKYQIPFELHIFPKGGHGLSLASKETKDNKGGQFEEEVSLWSDLFANWVENNI